MRLVPAVNQLRLCHSPYYYRESFPAFITTLLSHSRSGHFAALTRKLMSSPTPQYVYKIGFSFPSNLSPHDVLPLSDLDENDGFIHLSTAEQVPSTVGHFFKTTKQITLLKIALKDVEPKIKWEALHWVGVFPHIYGDLISRDISDRKTYAMEDPAGWEALLKADTAWLQ